MYSMSILLSITTEMENKIKRQKFNTINTLHAAFWYHPRATKKNFPNLPQKVNLPTLSLRFTAALWLKTVWAVCTTTGFLAKITRIRCTLSFQKYSSGQNKVPIMYRLVSDFTAKSFRKVASIIAQPEHFSIQTLFYFRVRLRNN